jgi:hypothetical protein
LISIPAANEVIEFRLKYFFSRSPRRETEAVENSGRRAEFICVSPKTTQLVVIHFTNIRENPYSGYKRKLINLNLLSYCANCHTLRIMLIEWNSVRKA